MVVVVLFGGKDMVVSMILIIDFIVVLVECSGMFVVCNVSLIVIERLWFGLIGVNGLGKISLLCVLVG